MNKGREVIRKAVEFIVDRFRYVDPEDLVRQHTEKGEYGAALDTINAAIRENPGDPGHYFSKAYILEEMGRFEDAERFNQIGYNHFIEQVKDLNTMAEHTLLNANHSLDRTTSRRKRA